MKIYSEMYKLIKRMDKLESENKALRAENEKLKEQIAVIDSKVESNVVDINIKMDNIIEFDSDLLNRIETLEIDNGTIRERRKK